MNEYLKRELEYEGKIRLTVDEANFVSDLYDHYDSFEFDSKETAAPYSRKEWDGLPFEHQRMILRGLVGLKGRKRVTETAKFAKKRYDWLQQNPDLLSSVLPNHDAFHQGWPSYVAGQDSYGHWVNYEPVNEFEVNNLDKMSVAECILQRCQYYEAQSEMKRRISARLGKRVTKNVYILDLKGLSLRKHFVPKVKKIIPPLLDECGGLYPDVLWSMYIINAPSVFKFVWRVVMPWVDPAIRPKIKILGGPSHFLPIMQENGLSLENIPKACGGNCDMQHMGDIIKDIIEKQNYFGPSSELAMGEELKALMEEDYLSNRIETENINFEDTIFDESYKNKPEDVVESLNESEGGGVLDEDFDDDILFEGYMQKAGAINKGLKRRYFILSSKKLYYFTENPKTERTAILKGKIELYLITKIERSLQPTDIRSTRVVNKKVGVTSEPWKKLISVSHKNEIDQILLHTPHRVYSLIIEATEQNPNSEVKPKSVTELSIEWTNELAKAVLNDSCNLNFEADEDLDLLEREHYIGKKGESKHLKKGILKKRGMVNRFYKTRLFVLTTNGLYYYAMTKSSFDPKDLTLKKKIRLDDIVKTEQLKKDESKFWIHTKENKRLYRVKAETKEECAEWLEAIQTARDIHEQAHLTKENGETDDTGENEATESTDPGYLGQWLQTIVDFTSGMNILAENETNRGSVEGEDEGSVLPLIRQVSSYFNI
eukprot:snap_masked-scaffold_34-processed-gene-3.29-mRNA-1 protein AED:1.00 eAED:1.00 QI:0/-1/0/0/-1/1/1/0/713